MKKHWIAPAILVFSRLLLLLALPLEGMVGYGDFIHFFRIANLAGWPYIHYWSEFPPIFPFLGELIYRLSAGRETTFDTLLILVLTVADALNLYLFSRLADRLFQKEEARVRLGGYLLCLAGLAYTWWYFDSIAVLAMLLGLLWILEQQPVRAGVALGLGILIKWFPVLLIPLAIKKTGWRKGVLTGIIAIGLSALVYGGLALASPKFTAASLQSQSAKGSWETPWALLDGNLTTGNFGPEIERLDARTASRTDRNPAVIPTWVTLLVFGGLGLATFLRLKVQTDRQIISFGLITFGLFFLWSPGWSPQWILYFLPPILLALPIQTAALLGGTIILANLMEWPVLLSRGMFWTLPMTIGIRTLLMILQVVAAFQSVSGGRE